MLIIIMWSYRGYLDTLCEEINDNLQEMGQLDVSQLSKTFTLPYDFLLEVGSVFLLKWN